MDPFPHTYRVRGYAHGAEDVALSAGPMPMLRSASPAEFGGPGDLWSPETLLVAALADCFILTFRALARASSLPWTALECHVEGTLDRVERATQFTGFAVRARLVVPATDDLARAHAVLEKAERHCLISRSLKGAVHLDARVDVESTSTIQACEPSGKVMAAARYADRRRRRSTPRW